MHFQKWIGLAFCGALLGGCAIHPVQEDFTGIRTSEIVRHIRCETRAAILEKAFALIRKERGLPSTDDVYDRRQGVPQLGFVSADNGPVDLQRVRSSLNERELRFFERYIETGIAFIFTFEATEENNVGFAVDPVQTLTRGMFGVQFLASANHSRINTRNFTIAETFDTVLSDPLLVCADYHPIPNLSYPISGSVGIYSVIDPFIDLNQGDPLRKSDDVKAVLTDKVPLFGDTLVFTTNLNLAATPNVTLTGVGPQWSLAKDTNFTPAIRRQDKHTLAIGLSLAEMKPGVHPAKGAASSSGSKLLFRAPYQLSNPPLGTLGLPTQPKATPQERALGTAREQLFLNFYNRLAR